MDFPAESIMQMTLAALPDVNISCPWLRRRGNRMGGRDNEKDGSSYRILTGLPDKKYNMSL